MTRKMPACLLLCLCLASLTFAEKPRGRLLGGATIQILPSEKMWLGEISFMRDFLVENNEAGWKIVRASVPLNDVQYGLLQELAKLKAELEQIGNEMGRSEDLPYKYGDEERKRRWPTEADIARHQGSVRKFYEPRLSAKEKEVKQKIREFRRALASKEKEERFLRLLREIQMGNIRQRRERQERERKGK